MTQAQEKLIIIPRPADTVSTGGLQLLDSPPSMRKEILGFFPQDVLPEGRIFRLSRSVPVDMLQQTLNENMSLREKVRILQDQMAELRSDLGLDRPKPRKISKAQAKREIAAYFEANTDQTIYPSDVSAVLNLDYGLVSEAIEQLENEGQVAKAEA